VAVFSQRERQLRVESASSVVSGADAPIGSANYHFIKSSLTGMAEQQTFGCIGMYDCIGSK
jgi:hypothetical protein